MQHHFQNKGYLGGDCWDQDQDQPYFSFLTVKALVIYRGVNITKTPTSKSLRKTANPCTIIHFFLELVPSAGVVLLVDLFCRRAIAITLTTGDLLICVFVFVKWAILLYIGGCV